MRRRQGVPMPMAETQVGTLAPLDVVVHHPKRQCMYSAHHAALGLASTCATAASATPADLAPPQCRGDLATEAYPAPFTAVTTGAVTTRPRTAKFFRRSGNAPSLLV